MRATLTGLWAMLQCGCMNGDVGRLVCHSPALAQTEISQELLDELPLHSAPALVVPTGWIATD